MKKELTKKTGVELMAQAPESAWGSEDALTRDILIPRLLLMQGLSDFVAQEKATMGDVVDSTTGKVLANKTKSLSIIPIMTFSTWAIFEKVGAKLEWKRMEPMTPENQDWEWETEVNGVYQRRDQCLNFYVLLADQALNPAALPYVLSFRRTSYREGQKLATHFITSRRINRPPAATLYNLGCRKEQNDHGTYYTWTLEQGGATDPKAVNVAYSWYQTIKSGVAKVDVESEFQTAKAPEEVRDVAATTNGAGAQF